MVIFQGFFGPYNYVLETYYCTLEVSAVAYNRMVH